MRRRRNKYGYTERQWAEWRAFKKRLTKFKRRERLKMAKQVSELRDERHEIAGHIMKVRKEISELNRANQQDGPKIGMPVDHAMLKRRVERHNKVERLEIEATDAEKKLATLDRKLAVIEADEAEAKVRDAVKQLQNGGAPAAWAQLRDNMLMLVHHKRVGQSSVMVLRKIERLSQPGTTHGVRVRENVGDFLGWIRKPAEAAA